MPLEVWPVYLIFRLLDAFDFPWGATNQTVEHWHHWFIAQRIPDQQISDINLHLLMVCHPPYFLSHQGPERKYPWTTAIHYIHQRPSPTVSESPLLMFADDCKCLHTISTHFDRLLLQRDLASQQSWSCVWKLAINPSKCKHTSFSASPEEHSHHTYLLNHYTDLGINFSNNLLWSHYYSIITKAYNTLSLSIVLSHLAIPSSPNLLHIHLLSELALPTAVKSGALLGHHEHVMRSTKFVLNNYHF